MNKKLQKWSGRIEKIWGGFLVSSLVVLAVITALHLLLPQSRAYERQRYAHKFYKPVQASVLSSEVKKAQSETGPLYVPLIRYEYEADGVSYTQERYRYSKTYPAFGIPALKPEGKKQVEKIAARYPAGKQITAYYDPRSPAQAVLDDAAPVKSTSWLFTAFFIFFLICMIVRDSLRVIIEREERRKLANDNR